MSFTFPRLSDRRNAATDVTLTRTLSVDGEGDSFAEITWPSAVVLPPALAGEISSMGVFGIPQTRET